MPSTSVGSLTVSRQDRFARLGVITKLRTNPTNSSSILRRKDGTIELPKFFARGLVGLGAEEVAA